MRFCCYLKVFVGGGEKFVEEFVEEMRRKGRGGKKI